MKIKLFVSLLLGAALSVNAQQGYKDGVEYYKAGNYDKAKVILERTLNDASTNRAEAYYYLGQSELALKNKAAAKADFDKGVQTDANNAYNYVGLGALDLQNGNITAADENFKKAEKLAGKDNSVLVSIARAYYEANPTSYEKKINDYLTKAHKKSKDQEPSIYILEGDMIIDKAVENPALVGDAVAKYEMAIRFDETSPEGYAKYANAYFRVDNPNAKRFAVQKFEEFLSKNPNSALAQSELAEKYYMNDQWSKAAEQYGKYIQNPNHFPEDETRYAVLLYASGDYDKSNQVASKVLESDPSNFLMQRLLLLNSFDKGDNEAAVAAGEKFFANNPNGYFNSNDYKAYGSALQAIGKEDEAFVQYDKAVQIDPKNGELLKEVSVLYNKAKNYPRAAELYGQYIATCETPSVNDLFTASGRYLNAAAKSDSDEDRAAFAAKGLEAINSAIEKAEPNADLYMRRARLDIVANGNKPDEKAVADFYKMIEILDQNPENKNPQNPDNYLDDYKLAYNFIGYYYTLTDNKEKAAETQEKYNEIQKIMTPGE